MNFHFQDEPHPLDAHQDLQAFLADAASWSSFAASLLEQLRHGRAWSEKQVAAAERMKAKCEAKAAEPEAPTVNHGSLLAAFDRAKASGLKYPAITLGPMKITKASDGSRNPGHLYIKLEGEYAGKITPGGQLLSRGLAPSQILQVTDLLSDPEDAARVYGKETGQCCCCGRELTNPDSIAAGIGPICAERWGL